MLLMRCIGSRRPTWPGPEPRECWNYQKDSKGRLCLHSLQA